MAQRLQKILAEAGLMSRREAEQAIQDGRVTVNGIPAGLGDRAEEGDLVELDGRPVPAAETKRYYMLNKPRGYVCTLHDEKGRRSVRELLPADAGRLYPVGRLDLMSEGLLLMTNDGDFSYRLTHPSHGFMKTYRTRVSAGAAPQALEQGIRRLKEPFFLDSAEVRAAGVAVLKKDGAEAVLDITIGEGRNREIRRMCEEAGLRVERLVRIAEGPLRLGTLKSGQARPLTREEIAQIMEESRT